MRETIVTYAPKQPSHRFAIAFAAALLAVLAFGDAFGFIMFPMFRLGLPDTAAANTAVFLVGVGLVGLAYELAHSAMREGPVAPAGSTAGSKGSMATRGSTPTASTRESTSPFGGDGEIDRQRIENLDPVQTLKVRYAMGEIDDATFEHKLGKLRGDDANLDRHSQEAQRLSEVEDRQTMIDRVENRQTVIE